ncbi:MAG TPA: hypothetical protein VNZ44_10005, partial [Pyrinomonadaceae bacterium]|nr:hypothetical protein [Pyrinomonadaceae bacterium]
SPLFLVCSLAGVLLIAGSLYLLRKGILDFKSAGMTKMKLGNAAIETSVPAVAMFVLGVAGVIYPVYKSPELCPDKKAHEPQELVKLLGKVSTAARVEVNAVVDTQEANFSKGFVLSVPYVPNRRYVVRYLDACGHELDNESLMLGHGERSHELNGLHLQGTEPATSRCPEQQFKSEQTESADVAAKYGR